MWIETPGAENGTPLRGLLETIEAIPEPALPEQREQAEKQFIDTINKTVRFINGIADADVRRAVIDAYQGYAQANAKIVAYLKDPANYIEQGGKLKPLPIPPDLQQAGAVPVVALPNAPAPAIESPQKIEQLIKQEPEKEQGQQIADQLKQGGTIDVAGVKVSADNAGAVSGQLSEQAVVRQFSEKMGALLNKLLDWLGRLLGIDLGSITASGQDKEPAPENGPNKGKDRVLVTKQQEEAVKKLKAMPGFGKIERDVFNHPIAAQNVITGKVEGKMLNAEWKGIQASFDLDDLDQHGVANFPESPFNTKEGVLIHAWARKVLVFAQSVFDWKRRPEAILKMVRPPLFSQEQTGKLRDAIAQKEATPDDSRCTYFHYMENGRAVDLMALTQKMLMGITSVDAYNEGLAASRKEAKEWGMLQGDYPPADNLDTAKAQAKKIGEELAVFLAGPEYQP